MRRIEDELGGDGAAALLARMAKRIRAAREILITAHIHPDGDALGSELALLRGLAAAGKRGRIVNDHPAPGKYDFLDASGAVGVLPEGAPPESLGDFDLGILLDTSEPGRAGRLEPALFSPDRDRICLDHHPGERSDRFSEHWVAPASPATGNLVLRLLDALDVVPDRRIAEPLFVAIATDTGWFRFSNTSPLALSDAARLVGTGLDVEGLHRRVYEGFRPPRIILLGKVFADLRLELDGRFAWSLVDWATLQDSGVPYEELDGFSEELKKVGGVEMVALLVETAPSAFKCSLRAKGEAPVNGIAARFGGGGHAKAAGFRIQGAADEVVRNLVEAVRPVLTGFPAA